jgi:hypothetical protein
MSLFRWRDGRCAPLMADGGSFSECRACFRIGLHIGTDSKRIYCHRCRTASLERFYDQFLEIDGFTTDIKRIILWNIFRHPVAVFKNEARELRVHHMTDLLRGLGHRSHHMTPSQVWRARQEPTQRLWISFSSHDASSQRNNILLIINEHMHYDRRWGVNLRGKRYRVAKGNLMTGNHFFHLIIDFLF